MTSNLLKIHFKFPTFSSPRFQKSSSKFHWVCSISDSMNNWYKGINKQLTISNPTWMQQTFLSSFLPLPPCLPPSVLLFQQQPHSSAPQAYTGAPLCNAGSFWFSGVTKKMQKGRRDAHEEASVDVMCHYRCFFFVCFFLSRCHVFHITLWFLLLASSIQGAPGLSGRPNEWEMEQNDTWRLATTGQVRRTHGHDR